MTSSDHPQLTLAVYSSDVWGHVCPVVRLTGPAEMSGMTLLKGNDWDKGGLKFSLNPIDQADLVVVLRDFPRWQAEYRQVVEKARSQGKKVVYGIDDLLIDLPEEHPGAVYYRTVRHLILGSLLEADDVFVTTQPLRDALLKYNPNIHILPNYLNDRLWHLRAPREKDPVGPVIIGYQGGTGHLPDLEMITPALVRVIQRYGNQVKFKFWGAMPPKELRDWPNVEWLDVGLTDYAEFAQYFQEQVVDICLAPIADHLFNACKSPLKFTEYSALSIPGVYSRVAPYQSVITPGVDGLLAESAQEWEDALVRLIEDDGLRRSMGLAAQNTVRERWLLSEHAQEWPQAFARILQEPDRAPLPAMVPELVQMGQRWSESLETTIAEQSAHLDENAKTITHLQTDLNNIQGSLGWSLLMLAHRMAGKIAPPDSLRGRAMRRGLRELKALRLGQRSLGLSPATTGESIYVINCSERNPLRIQLRRGTPLTSPAISILIPGGEGLSSVNEAVLQDWLAGQTVQDVELVRWDQSVDSGGMLAGLRGKYVCAASHDLLRQSPTYLETNLVALESEGLAFTLNALGSSEWMAGRLRAGSLPGSRQFPLLRQVVRKDCLDANLKLDLSRWIAPFQGQPGVVGKLITHTSSQSDQRTALPYNLDITGTSVCLLGSYIMAYPFGREIPQGVVNHPVYELDSVLPKRPIPSNLPTVVMVMPFLAVGGAETIHINMMRCLQDRARFVVLTFESHASELGTTVEEFRKLTPYVYTLPDYLLHHLNLSMVRYLFEQFQPETLYIANGATWIYNGLADIRKAYPNVYVVNQVYDHQAGWINRYDAALVRQIDAHISSNYKIDQAYIQRGAKKEQVYHIENGVDMSNFDLGSYSTEQIQAIKAGLGLPADRKVVTYIGRLHAQKRPVDFVEMARRCESDPTLAFLMVGDGPLANAVNAELRKTGLTNFYRRPFYRPSSDIYAVSDVIVLTSEYEGMPMVVLETQSMGKPVVATDVGNIREVLEKTHGGQIAPRIGDINGLVAAVQQVLANPPSAETIRTGIREHYSLQQMSEAYAKALRLK